MTDQGPSSDGQSQPAAAVGAISSQVDERPEFAVGGAFAGGLILALILKRLAR